MEPGNQCGVGSAICLCLINSRIYMITLFFVVEPKGKDPLLPSVALKGKTGLVLGYIAAGWP